MFTSCCLDSFCLYCISTAEFLCTWYRVGCCSNEISYSCSCTEIHLAMKFQEYVVYIRKGGIVLVIASFVMKLSFPTLLCTCILYSLGP